MQLTNLKLKVNVEVGLKF